jgi:hypothetical protein
MPLMPLPSFLISASASRCRCRMQTLPPTCAFFPCRRFQALLSTATARQHQPPPPSTSPPTRRFKPLPPKIMTAARAPSVLKLKMYVYIFNNHFFIGTLTTHIVSFVCFFAKILVKDVYRFGQIVMGWANHQLGKLATGSPEDCHFWGFFGVLAEVAVEAWEMINEQKCLPSDPIFLHYLWVWCTPTWIKNL